MKLLFYSPQMEGHPQVYCRVLAEIFTEAGHQVVIAGGGKDDSWPAAWTYLAPLLSNPGVGFVNSCSYSATGAAELRAEELNALQVEHRVDSTLLIEGDYFADELRRIADGSAARLHGRVVGVFARTSGWYPREDDYGGAPEPGLLAGGVRQVLRRLRTRVFHHRQSPTYFYETVLIAKKGVDAVVVKDERVAERFGPPVYWMPEIFRLFEDAAPDGDPAAILPADMRAFIECAGRENVLLYFGTGARYKGYDYFLKLAELDSSTFALHAGAPLRAADRGQMLFDVEAIRARLLSEGRLFETGGFVEDERLVHALFQIIERFVSTHRLTLSSGTMLQALDYGKPVLTAATGQVGYRTQNFNLGMTYCYGDAEHLRDQWIQFRAAPVAQFEPSIRAYMQRYSRDEIAKTFSALLLPA